MVLLWATNRLSFSVGAELSIDIYRRTLYQPYEIHCARNSSEVISGISSKASNLTHGIIIPLLVLTNALLVIFAIAGVLIVLDPIVATMTFGGFGLVYAVIVGLTRKRLVANSERVARESVNTVKSLQEGLGGIRDVLIDGTQSTYCQAFGVSDMALRRAQGNIAFIAASPRYVMESLGMLLVAALAYWISRQPEGIEKAIPILGALAVAAQRLLPALQQAYASWSGIRGGQASLQDTLELLDQPLPQHAEMSNTKVIPFEHSIRLKRLGFRYASQASYVFNGVDLTIPKGSRIGIIGSTGSGKSTLLDVIMGLLPPTDGVLEVDGQSITRVNVRPWQAHIAHVPQFIFLTDGSVEENIALGVSKEKIDSQRVREAAKQARIDETIDSLRDKYQTNVGERGVRLSGGQRQRIGIARALYKKADVIIFDEATSALDGETEQTVMQAIEGLSEELTLIIIAHRLTTLKNCTHIFEMSNGEIKHVGDYLELCNQMAVNQ